jgi:large subunit ribosomal protein L24e
VVLGREICLIRGYLDQTSRIHREHWLIIIPNLQEIAKKRTRRAVKHQRAIVGASLDVIKERRSQRPEARAAARSAAIKDAKEQKAETEKKKKADKAKAAAGAAKGQTQRIQSKQGAKGAPAKIQAKTR